MGESGITMVSLFSRLALLTSVLTGESLITTTSAFVDDYRKGRKFYYQLLNHNIIKKQINFIYHCFFVKLKRLRDFLTFLKVVGLICCFFFLFFGGSIF